MAVDAHKNFAASRVATVTDQNTLIVTAGEGALFPTPPFNVTIWPANTQPTRSNATIRRVTGIATDILTLDPAVQEGVNARTILVGDQIDATITAKALTDIETALVNDVVQKSGSTMTGQLNFSGTDHAGIKLNSLTITQRNALTPANGMVIYNTTLAQIQKYENGEWVDIGKSPATKVIAPSGSGFSADYYTDGTDDDVQINAALVAINAVGGGTVILYPGFTYNIAHYLTPYSNTTLIAYGAYITLTATAYAMIQDAYHTGSAGSINHLSIRGGIWNAGSNLTGRVVLVGGTKIEVRDLEIKSTSGNFAINVHNATDFVVENIYLNSVNSDGVHISGPASAGVIKNIRGLTNDDMVAIMPNEYTPYTASGDVTDIVVDTVIPVGQARANVVRILSGTSGATVYNTKRIKVRNVSGSMATGYQGGIWIGDDTGNANTSNGQMDDILIDGVSITLPDANNPIIKITGSSTSLTIPTIKLSNITVASNCHSVLYLNAAKVTNLFLSNVSGQPSNTSISGIIYNPSSVTDVTNLMVNNLAFTNSSVGSQLLNNFSSSSTHLRNVYLSNVYLKNLAQIMDTASATDLYLSNIRLVSNTRVLNLRSGSTVVVRACDGVYGDNMLHTITSTGTLQSKSPLFPIDITDAQLTKAKGDMGYNTNVSGTTGVGPVAYNGTSWEPLASTQDLYATSSPTFAGATLTGLSGVLKASTGVVAGSATTSDLTEGTNLYHTTARVQTVGDARYLQISNNLSDVATAATARTNLGLGNVENTAISTWAGSSNITTLGTIATGVWQGTAIDHTKLTGIVQSDVGGLTTASTPTFAGLNLGTGNLSTVGNISIDGTAARDITVAANTSGNAGQGLTVAAGNAGSGTDLAGGNAVIKTGLGTGTGTTQFQVWVNKPASSTGSGAGTSLQAFFVNSSSGGTISIQAGASTGSFNFIANPGSGTNGAGNAFNLIGGQSRGTGAPGRTIIQGSPLSTTSGSTLNGNVDRVHFGATKVLTDNSAINLVSCTLASGSAIGGLIRYTIEATDGTDYQSESGYVVYNAVNKAGTVTRTITEHDSQQALSGGTLATTWAISAASPAVISVNADTSLTPSTGYPRITYTVENYGQQAIAIQ